MNQADWQHPLLTGSFNGRVAREVLQVCVACHEDLEILLTDFCLAYNHRKQRVLAGLSPTEHITSWLRKHPRSRNPDYAKPDSQDIMKQVDEILKYANDASQPDKWLRFECHSSNQYRRANRVSPTPLAPDRMNS